MSETDQNIVEQPKGPGGRTFLVVAAAAILFASNGYLLWRVNRLSDQMLAWRTSMMSDVSELREASSTSAAANQRKVETLREELAAARFQASQAAGKARKEAEKHAEQLAAQLADAQQRQQQAVETELSGVKQAAGATDAKVADVSNDVAATKNDVAATKTELSSTIADLKRARGDMGVMSGLIATNGQELAALKELGERNYYEFKLGRTKAPQKVGDIGVLLRKTDPKRNKYTVDIFADDKKVEKKDKNTNEPVQFYTGKARQPYELVVNEVQKDRLVGYLATPKVQLARQ